MIKLSRKNQEGLLLVELITAMAVFILGLVTVFSLFTLSIEGTQLSLERTNARLLSQETMEAAKSLETRDPTLLTPGLYEVGVSAENEWVLLPKQGLVGHFLFDGDIEDETPHENEAEAEMIGFAEDRLNNPDKAIRFNGEEGGVRVYHDFSLRVSGPLTISAFVWHTGEEDGYVAGRYDEENQQGEYLLKKEDDSYIFEIFGEDGQREAVSAPAEEDGWVHLAGVYEPVESVIRIYVNGNLENTKEVDIDELSEGEQVDFTVGTADLEKNSMVWEGRMSDLRIYNRSLTSRQVEGLYNNYSAKEEKDLEVSNIEEFNSGWSFNEGEGCMVYDNGENYNYGYFRNCDPENWTYGRLENPGRALEFTGLEHIEIPESDSLRVDEDITLSLWVKLPEEIPSGRMTILEKRASSQEEYTFSLAVDGDEKYYEWAAAEGNPPSISSVRTPENTLKPGKWHHIFATFDGETRTIYLNNDRQEKTFDTISDSGSETDLFIGQKADRSQNLKGVIDEVRIYDKILNDMERRKVFFNRISYFLR